jgi:hypothetical protein
MIDDKITCGNVTIDGWGHLRAVKGRWKGEVRNWICVGIRDGR